MDIFHKRKLNQRKAKVVVVTFKIVYLVHFLIEKQVNKLCTPPACNFMRWKKHSLPPKSEIASNLFFGSYYTHNIHVQHVKPPHASFFDNEHYK